MPDVNLVAATPEQVVVVSSAGMMAYDAHTGARNWPRTRPAALGDLRSIARQTWCWAQEAGPGSSRVFAHDLTTGERVQTPLDTQHGTVCSAVISPDTTIIAVSSCNEGTVALWALDGTTATGTPLEGAGWASAADLWSPDGRYVAAFRLDAPTSVEVIDMHNLAHIAADGVFATPSDSPILRPDDVLQTVSEDNHVVEFDPRTRQTRDTGIVLPGGHVDANVAPTTTSRCTASTTAPWSSSTPLAVRSCARSRPT